MTLRDMIENGITIEGYVKVQCWEDMDNPTIYWEGYANEGIKKNLHDYLDREICYIFSYNTSPNIAAICIELAEEED